MRPGMTSGRGTDLKAMRGTASSCLFLIISVTTALPERQPTSALRLKTQHNRDGDGRMCKRVIWFMGLRSSEDSDYNIYLKVALLSAKENAPSLIPVLIYSGAAGVATAWFERQGGTVLFHDLPFFDDLPEVQKPSSGAYLRLEIPNLMAALEPIGADTEPDFVLYTDLDVMFLQNFDSCSVQPQPDILALGAEHNHGAKENSGIMYIKVAALAEHRERILALGRSRNFTPGFDQPLTLAYFAQEQITQLPDRFNWKPYWGESDEGAVIVHFHGPKPRQGKQHLQCLLIHKTAIAANCPEVPPSYVALFQLVPDAGAFYNLMLQKFEVLLMKARTL